MNKKLREKVGHEDKENNTAYEGGIEEKDKERR